jgi:crossover junction endodeoxyribonuclease RuvC
MIIGIDPGKAGGIVILNRGKIIDISVMPATPRDLYKYFISMGFPKITNLIDVYVFIEKVHSMPNQGVVSSFTFGQGLGRLEGVLACMNPIEPFKVNPKEWQGWLNIDKGEDWTKSDWKNALLAYARKMEKGKEKKLTLKTADAYLIAKYGEYIVKDENRFKQFRKSKQEN